MNYNNIFLIFFLNYLKEKYSFKIMPKLWHLILEENDFSNEMILPFYFTFPLKLY